MGEGGINTSQDGQEVGFGCVNGMFSRIASVNTRGYKLVGSLPGLGDGLFAGSIDFIIKDLEVSLVPPLSGLFHYGIVGC